MRSVTQHYNESDGDGINANAWNQKLLHRLDSPRILQRKNWAKFTSILQKTYIITIPIISIYFTTIPPSPSPPSLSTLPPSPSPSPSPSPMTHHLQQTTVESLAQDTSNEFKCFFTVRYHMCRRIRVITAFGITKKQTVFRAEDLLRQLFQELLEHT